MPDGATTKDFWKWVEDTYGYGTAIRLKQEMGSSYLMTPFFSGVDQNHPIYRFWYENVLRRGGQPTAGFTMPPSYGMPITTYEEYLSTLRDWLVRLVMDAGVSSDTAEAIRDNVKNWITRGVPVSQLPFYEVFTSPDEQTRDYELYKVKTRQKDWTNYVNKLTKDWQKYREEYKQYAEETLPAWVKEQADIAKRRELVDWQTLELGRWADLQRQKEYAREKAERGFLSALEDQERLRAAEAREQAELEAARQARREPMPEPEEAYSSFVEAIVSPAQRQYFQRRLSDIYGKFEREHEGLRQQWWNTLQTFTMGAAQPTPYAPMSSDIAAAERYVGRGEDALQSYLNTAYRYRQNPASEEFRGLPREAREALGSTAAGIGSWEAGVADWSRQAKRRDPWEEYLEKYPAREEWLSLPPWQRGFYTSRFAPKAMWRT